MKKKAAFKKIARRIFAPAIYIVNRLRYLEKFVLISAIFTIPIAVSMYLLIQKNIHHWVHFTQEEVEGVGYISKMRDLLEDLQAHRGLAMIFIAGDVSAKDLILAMQADIDSDMKGLEGLVRKFADEPLASMWNDIKYKWLRLENTLFSLSAAQSFKDHDSIIEDLRRLREITAYKTNLLLDPDPDSFFLTNLIIRDLPRLTDRVERLSALCYHILAKKSLGPDEREQVVFSSGTIMGSIDTLAVETNILDSIEAFKSDPAFDDIKAGIATARSKAENYLSLVEKNILRAGRLDISPWEFFNTSTTDFLGPINKTYEISEKVLMDRFSARSSLLARQTIIAWAATITVLALVLYLLAGFYFSVTDTVSRLDSATRKMSATGLPETIKLDARDELNDVARLFNEVGLALRKSHELLLHSERLAKVGSWDLDPKTRKMQWSPEMYAIYGADPAASPNPGIEMLFRGVHHLDSDMVRDRIERGLKTGIIPLFEYRLVLPDGSVRHLSCEGEASHYPDGSAYAMTGFVQDITERKKTEEDLREALKKVKQLSGLLPICANCKKIRNDTGYWESIEYYIESHSEAEFSHSLCDECAKKLYPDYFKDG